MTKLSLSGDDVDGLLRAFFHGELPRPWPKPPVPHKRPTSSLGRSRLALAAAIGLLLVGPWFLAGKLNTVAQPVGSGPEIGTRETLDKGKPVPDNKPAAPGHLDDERE